MHFGAAHYLSSFVVYFVEAFFVDIDLANVMNQTGVPLTSIAIKQFTLFLMKKATTDHMTLPLTLDFILRDCRMILLVDCGLGLID